MGVLKGKTVVLCVSGGIAAYKSAELTSKLKKAGAKIHVVMTKSACEFITPITFEALSGNRTVTDTFSREFAWEVEHISLAKAADVFAVVPATANVIAKMAHGIADDMVTTTILATRAPVVVAPAMNTAMFENIATQENIETLRAHGMQIVAPVSGRLACGDTGSGKLASVEDIFAGIEAAVTAKDLQGKRILVTAGPTRESLDPVRFLTNHSSGKMGYAVAACAAMRGAEVTLVSGPVAFSVPSGVSCIAVESAQQMYDAVLSRAEGQDIVIKAAAVADYRPVETAAHKIKKSGAQMSIALEKTADILAALGERKTKKQVLCGFAMETQDLLQHAEDKLHRKKCDMLVANNLTDAGAGFQHDTNQVTLLFANGKQEPLPLMEKSTLADVILDRLLTLCP